MEEGKPPCWVKLEWDQLLSSAALGEEKEKNLNEKDVVQQKIALRLKKIHSTALVIRIFGKEKAIMQKIGGWVKCQNSLSSL